MQLHKIVGKCLLYGCRWLLDVKHITANKQCIGLFILTPVFQLTEEVLMLITSVVVLIDDLAKMQVGSM